MGLPQLKVTSHVGRDFLQSAQLFKHEHIVVWEYVANGLQYVDPTTKPVVVVSVDAKLRKIQIRDNGRGMSLVDLQRYFQMHAENLDRKKGKPGRGYFGTGKSAAFGIATLFRITTIQNGRRTKVQLTREEIEAQEDGQTIPINILENEVRTTSENGTLVEIENVFQKHLDVNSIRRHIERNIAHWPNVTVILNNVECEFVEPDINSIHRFEAKGSEFESLLGDAVLEIKVAKAPLEDELRGIAVISETVLYESTLAGCDRKPFAEYLFGSLDVAALSHDKSPIPAFDMSRSMRLNPRNEIVAELLRFIGVHLESIRKELERQDRARKQSEEQKRLEKQAEKIAEIINNHFKGWSKKLRNTMAKAGGGKDLLPADEQDSSSATSIVLGDELFAKVVRTDEEVDSPPEPPSPEPNPNPLPAVVELDETSKKRLAKESKSASTPKAASGGFRVAFDKIGENEKRAKYDRGTRTIFINLEHPRVAFELKRSGHKPPVDDPNFLRLAYEIAITEYSIVLAQELSGIQFYMDTQEALVDVRQTLDDLSKVYASVCASME